MPSPPPCDWLVIAFEKLDRLKILGSVPADLAAALTRSLGDVVQKTYSGAAHFEVKIKGLPWVAVHEEGVRTQRLLLATLDALQLSGFALYGSVRMQQLALQDVLVVQRQKDWRPGMPVWQR